jgi:RNA polymerase sigma-70 factor (ECF subfamily)
VLLKDVFEYSLEEIAGLVDSTIGGVKAALKRGRLKLANLPERGAPRREKNREVAQLLRLYVERFNRRDWDGLRELIAADARLRVADRFAGRVVDSPYFGNYERWTVPWRMVLGKVDGEPVILRLEQEVDRWMPKGIVRLITTGREVTSIADYGHCPWIMSAAGSVIVGQPSPN